MCGSISESYNIFYSKYIVNSSNIWFSTNLIGCDECILCDRIENKKYCIKNKQYDYEEYMRMKSDLMKQKNIFQQLYERIIHIPAQNIGSENVNGSNITKSHNTTNSLWISRIHNSRNVAIGNGGDSCDFFFDAVDV